MLLQNLQTALYLSEMPVSVIAFDNGVWDIIRTFVSQPVLLGIKVI
jgi:hypothetical protein